MVRRVGLDLISSSVSEVIIERQALRYFWVAPLYAEDRSVRSGRVKGIGNLRARFMWTIMSS